MIDWMMAGALGAILLAELVDAWVLRELARRCSALPGRTPDRARRVREYAEGFDHSRAVTGWLRTGSLVLAALSVGLGAHAWVIAGAVALAIAAHGECRFSVELRRRYLYASSRCSRRVAAVRA